MESTAKVEDYRRAARIHLGIAVLYILYILVFGYLMGIKSGHWSIVVFIGFLFSAHFLSYYGLSRNQGWAKALSGLLAFGLLFGVPLGTILGGAILYYMFRKASVQADDISQSTADVQAD